MSVAVALGSERMAAMAASFLGFYEVHLGSLGSAMRRWKALLDTGAQLNDSLLATAHHRLGLYLGSLSGLRSLAEASKKAYGRVLRAQ